jgi:hypothetical protein
MQEMEEPVDWRIRGDQLSSPTVYGGSIYLPVVGREVDVFTVWIEHVVVVELRDVSDHDLIELSRCGQRLNRRRE